MNTTGASFGEEKLYLHTQLTDLQSLPFIRYPELAQEGQGRDRKQPVVSHLTDTLSIAALKPTNESG